jgi:hypothetical protein
MKHRQVRIAERSVDKAVLLIESRITIELTYGVRPGKREINRILLVTGVTACLGHSLNFVAQTGLAIDLSQLVQVFEQRLFRIRTGNSKEGRNVCKITVCHCSRAKW